MIEELLLFIFIFISVVSGLSYFAIKFTDGIIDGKSSGITRKKKKKKSQK